MLTKRAVGEDGKITALECVRVEWQLGDGGKMNLVEVPGSEFTLKADLVLLAMGFVGPRKAGLVEQAGVELDPRGNVKADTVNYKTSAAKIFACGDMRRGQSLVVWAIREGRQCARGVDEFLMGVRRTAALVPHLSSPASEVRSYGAREGDPDAVMIACIGANWNDWSDCITSKICAV